MATRVHGPQAVTEALIAFSAAIASRDVDMIMAAMTADCVWEHNHPAPDGERAEGQAAVRAMFEASFRAYPTVRFDGEDVIISGDRAVVPWNAVWDGGHVRGVDLFRFRDGKVAEKLSYVKGPPAPA
jgi:ketosteroid isomerase-like protein